MVLFSWRRLNPNYHIQLYNNEEMDLFVKQHVDDDFYQIYLNFPKSVMKSDFFRYLVLYEVGGIYSDMDTICREPADDWNDEKDNVNMIVGIEWFDKTSMQILQWTMAAKKKHPLMKLIIDEVMDYSRKRMMNGVEKDVVLSHEEVYNWTGPGIWSGTIMNYFKEVYNVEDWKEYFNMTKMDVRGRLVGDVYVLRRDGFNYFYGDEAKNVRVQHLFWGSWKNKHFLARLVSPIAERKELFFRCYT